MKKTNNPLIILTTVFASLAVVFLGLFLSYFITAKTYRNQLENSYMKSFYEMVDSVNSLEVDLSKIIATTSVDSQRELLSNVYNTCQIGVVNLNELPISYDKLSEINKLMNTMGGFSYSLLLENYMGKSISKNDYVQIESLYNKVRELQYDINVYMRKLQYDYSILDDVDFSDGDTSSFSGGVINTESSGAEVPTLIYDGPFSDSVINKEIKGLSNDVVSIDEVMSNLENAFLDDEVVYIGNTEGKFETYNFELRSDIVRYVSVTKQGGMLLSITAFGSGNGQCISVDDGLNLAESFANDLGFENMYNVWHQKSGNILYVNLAPIVNHVIYYPDLIKVKVDLSLEKVVGWEATNYATNHVDRSFSSSIGIIDAQESVSDILKIEERNICIIPDKFVGELSAYEFICSWEDYVYYIYIDANTGKEVNILRVIDTGNGQLLM